MLSQAMQDALNEQIKDEAYSAYLYLSMAAYYDAANLGGFAHWMRVQSREEWEHSLKLYDYVNDRKGRVVLQAIPQPPVEYGSPLDAFLQVLAHEEKVTAAIHRIYALAVDEKDYATQVELQWYVKEQVEEEKTAAQIVENLRAIGDSKTGLLMLDRHLGKREG